MGVMTGARAPFVCALPSAPRSHFPLKGEETESFASSPLGEVPAARSGAGDGGDDGRQLLL